MNNFAVIAYKSAPWWGKLELHIFDKATHSFAKNIEFEKAEDGMYYDPAIVIDYAAAQELMDSLWECGVRPTEGSGSAGAMKATQDHLKDMRKLVSNLLKVDL